MQGADEFGPNFQRILVRACVDDHGLRALIARFVNARQLAWTDPASAWAWRVIADSPHPTMLLLETESRRLAQDDLAASGVQTILASREDWRETDYVVREVQEWARRQTFAAGFEEAMNAWNAGRFDEAMRLMMGRIEEISSIRMESADRGWFFEDFDLRQQRRSYVAQGLDVFPCGIDKIDSRMYGGLSYGELGVPMAYSKIGKTFFSVQQGFCCVRTRRKCLHFVLEGGRPKTEDRYEARFSGTLYRLVRSGDIDTEALRIMRREYDILRQHLVIRGYADSERQWRITFEDLLAEVGYLRKEHGFVPDMIIVDYGDLVWASGDNERERQKKAFQQLKALAERQEFRGHRGYAVWAPTQAVRPSAGADFKEHVLRPRDVADTYDKIRISDALLTLNRTIHEKAHNQARVLLAAYRDAEDELLVRVQTDYDHGAFCVMGMEPPPLPEEDTPEKKGKK